MAKKIEPAEAKEQKRIRKAQEFAWEWKLRHEIVEYWDHSRPPPPFPLPPSEQIEVERASHYIGGVNKRESAGSTSRPFELVRTK